MKKVENFRFALKNLRETENYHQPYSCVELTGIVGLFEICFEQAWKAIKEVMQEEGYPIGVTESPKSILKSAFAMEIIAEEDLWLDALISRNNSAHAYNENIAMDIVAGIKTNYIRLFENLDAKFRQMGY